MQTATSWVDEKVDIRDQQLLKTALFLLFMYREVCYPDACIYCQNLIKLKLCSSYGTYYGKPGQTRTHMLEKPKN